MLDELRPMLALARSHRGLLGASLSLMLCESAAALLVPWAGGMLAAAILQEQAVLSPGNVLLAMLALFAAQAMLKFASTYTLETAADRIAADLRVRLYDHLQALPLAFYHRRRLGDTLALLTNDVYEVSAFVSGTAIMLVPLLLTAGGAVVLMFGIRADLALLASLLVPGFFVLLKLVGRRMRPLSLGIQNAEAAAIAMAQENLGMLPVIKVFTREPHESARYRAQLDRILELSARQRRLYAGVGPLLQFLAAAAIVLAFAIASGELGPALAPAQLVTFLLYAHLLTRPVAGLADVYGRMQVVRGALHRLRQAMDEPPEPAGAGATLPPVKGGIEFRGVRFAYEGRAPVLDGFYLRIGPAETVALVGPNGAGKSTLAHLLMRLHDPDQGSILIDGIDIATVSLESLRRQVGVVPQHVLLFNASVRENIAYGRPDTDTPAIEAAARAARAHDFIMRLPRGYDTEIGDLGVRLSGGERQRLALARALLKDPPILILDEATAMFDPRGEEEFLQSCSAAFESRTVILITHRPASLAVADRIVRLERGCVVADEGSVPC